MPYALDVDGSIKMHVGSVGGYPRSHGCFRIPASKGWFVNKIARMIGQENVLVTAYRAKQTLDENERTAAEINERLKKPQTHKTLRFFGVDPPVEPAPKKSSKKKKKS
jgi:hypothetical protein